MIISRRKNRDRAKKAQQDNSLSFGDKS